LIDAVVENLHRSDHTPVEEAKAFARLLEAGLTRRGICEQLSVTRERVRGRLRLLEVPRELHGAIDVGEIPLAAVPALVAPRRRCIPGCRRARGGGSARRRSSRGSGRSVGRMSLLIRSAP
jgi:hypothetical protein